MADSAADRDWTVHVAGFNPPSERAVETQLTIGNGLAGIRGALEEGSAWSHPGTFLAGVFDHLRSTPEPPDGLHDTPALIIAPNWLALTLRVDGEEMSLTEGEIVEHERLLLLRDGLVIRKWRQRLQSFDRIVRILMLRAALQSDRHAFIQQVWLTSEDVDARFHLKAALDGNVASGLVFEPDAHIASDTFGLLTGQTQGGEHRVAMAQSCQLSDDGRVIGVRQHESTASSVAVHWHWRAERGRHYLFERRVSCFSSRTASEPEALANRHVHKLASRSASSMVDEHRSAWAELWRSADVRIEGDPRLQRALRFASYHLMNAIAPDDEHVSIGARGLSGTAYLGHVFWDAEIYMLPFFVFTWPAAARALLMYRFHTLDAARAKAKALGLRGALYAWESVGGYEATPTWATGSNGEPVEIFTGRFAHHVAADVAYAVWQYWRATGDDEFLISAGAEIILETARFWASRATSDGDGQYHLRGVVGPDEYHEPVDDSAFTNNMARLNLQRGRLVATWFEHRNPNGWRSLRSRLELSDDEFARWIDVARCLANVQIQGVVEEFDGYFGLDDIDLRAFEPRSAALPVLVGLDRVARTQVVKQADVVLLCHLLREQIDPAIVAQNFDYYEPRCDHGSSLSPSIYALVAARLGWTDRARIHLDHAAAIDLNDRMGNSAQGIHLGACGGLWQAIVFGAAGMELLDDGLRFEPHLLPEWSSLSFTVICRGCRLEVTLRPAPKACEFVVTDGDGVWVELKEREKEFVKRGERRLIR